MAALAGKYGPLIGAAAGAVLGAGGSLIGNLTDKEQGEGPGRLALEAINAAGLAAAPGFMAGLAPRIASTAKRNAINAIKTAGPGSAEAIAAKQVARKFPAQVAAAGAAGIPLAAGIGGLYGGGGANLYNAIGVPGMQPGIDPESYGSSNVRYA